MINSIIFRTLQGISLKLGKNRCCDKLLYLSAMQSAHRGDVKINIHTLEGEMSGQPHALDLLTTGKSCQFSLVKRKSNLSYPDYSQATS